MITLTQRILNYPGAVISCTLTLAAEERTRSRHHFQSDCGESLHLQLPRGTVLRDGDLLSAEHDTGGDRYLVKVIAKPEPVMIVKASNQFELLRAAYHLGNRHVPLEINIDYLRLSPDRVLQDMLQHLGLIVSEELAPFQPEAGAYGIVTNYSHNH